MRIPGLDAPPETGGPVAEESDIEALGPELSDEEYDEAIEAAAETIEKLAELLGLDALAPMGALLRDPTAGPIQELVLKVAPLLSYARAGVILYGTARQAWTKWGPGRGAPATEVVEGTVASG